MEVLDQKLTDACQQLKRLAVKLFKQQAFVGQTGQRSNSRKRRRESEQEQNKAVEKMIFDQ